ncbi:afadin isoform X3 [Phlebotomus papatasi]|uniref:afadin isoform X3 n=1 Tax=Phlebotomus papatasi TaxID=29031 RepID=UPI0024840D5C|nr:afadin isoform X3 [Phlebotomus papatasi]
MKMSANEKRLMDREALHSVIRQWNANRLDLFELSPPDDNLQFHGVMRFYFQDAGQKVATKCIRVASDATVQDVIATLIEKFRPDMRMLSLPNYALYEVHSNHEERKLNGDEKPLLVQLNWNFDDREGRFLLRDTDQKTNTLESGDTNFKRKLSKREQKEQKKKKEKLQKMQSTNTANAENHVAEKLYTELPETSFTRSISNPEAVMRRRRQQKLEKKLQQFRSKDGGPDTGGTLKIYGESLCRDVPYKTLLLSIRDCAQAVVREMLAKYGLDKADPLHYCLVQVNSDGTEYILDDDECPLSILMNHPTSRGSIMFHVRRRPADSQPRRRKKKPLGVSNGSNNMSAEREGPMLVEVTHSGDGGRRIKLGSEPVEVGSANTNTLQLFGPPIQPRHCLISLHEGVCTVTPLHPDALTFVNGHHIQQPTILHNGSVVMFGRVSSYRFVDSPSDGRYNLALSQSQLDSACLYDSRSPTSPSWHEDERPLSPVQSIAQGQTLNKLSSYLDEPPSANQSIADSSQQHLHHHLNSNSTGQSGVGGQTPTVTSNVSTDNLTEQYMDDNKNLASAEPDTKQAQSQGQSRSKEQYETNFDVDGTIETETKSISSNKSAGSNQEIRSKIQSVNESGQEPILPAVLEFPETHQEAFLHQVIPDLDVNAPYFKLAPVYTLYLCARYRASTHYRPDLQPTERAHKLTAFLHHVANMIYTCVQEQYTDPKVVSFWMANSSEFLHFLKSDRHISAFSLQAQEVLAETVQSAFRHLVNSFQAELSQTLNQFLSENIDHDSAAGLVLTVLGADMALLRRCRVNAALTIQLFSQLFHYINVVCFNKIVTTPQMCNATWGKVVSDRLQLLELWAERLGLELAADCHLAKINQCAQFLQAPKTTVAEVQQLAHSCFRLNSLQMAALLSQEPIPRNLVDTALRMAESVADELTLADGREVRLEESTETQLALLLPEDGFSCDVVRGIPAGLVDFLTPLQNAGMCRLAAQPTSIGLWTVYMHQYNQRSPSAMSTKMPQPDIQVIKLHKNNGGMGLSIVAAKGAGQERLGIYIKSVVPGGAADADGRLQAGDQLLRVDGQSLIGITQERAADYLVRTGPVVTLEVAKQGAIYHGLATLLQQPSPVIQRGTRRMSERDVSRVGAETTKPPLPSPGGQQLLNSKSVPALHHVGNIGMAGNKSRSIHNLAAGQINDQGFYQNLSIYRGQNISQPNLGDRPQIPLLQPASSSASATQMMVAPPSNSNSSNISNQQQHLNRPASAYFNSNNMSNTNTLPSQTNSMSYSMLPQQQQQQQQMVNRPKNSFLRESQGQQSLRMNQMLAPSMPNIAHSSGYASNISASQSMQNVNMINYPTYPSQQQQQQQQPVIASKPPTGHQHQLYSPPDQAAQMRMQAKMSEMGEMLRRRNQREMMAPMGMLDMSNSSLAPIQQGSPMMATPPGKPPMMSPTGAGGMYGQQQYPPQQQQMSPLKQLPPTAPKPQHHRLLPPPDEQLSPPLPPSSTHPLFKQQQQQQPQYVASNAEPPKVAYYPMGNNGANKAFPGGSTNPWEREEREKEQEMRREHMRQWRDQQINELSGQAHRTPQQEEQLKTLVLERDFERRAQEMEEHEEEPDLGGNAKAGAGVTSQMGESHLPSEATVMQPKSILKHNNAARLEAPQNEGRGNLLISGSVPNSPSKQTKSASFADQAIHENNSAALMLSKEMSHLHVSEVSPGGGGGGSNFEQMQSPVDPGDASRENFEVTSNGGPPPPPERNSSYIVMSQQQQKLRNSQNLPQKPPGHLDLGKKPPIPSHLATNNNFTPPSSTVAPISAINFNRDNKRVSFHDEENNVVAGAASLMPEQADLEIIREDPNKFIQDTTALLQTPTTPENESWNSPIQQTPGVIGAQEVYRDPRTRRLAEQQQKNQKSNDTVPEKLSFKEKMKMFALESGENQTPKDKLKISRAQRDIDAVH